MAQSVLNVRMKLIDDLKSSSPITVQLLVLDQCQKITSVSEDYIILATCAVASGNAGKLILKHRISYEVREVVSLSRTVLKSDQANLPHKNHNKLAEVRQPYIE